MTISYTFTKAERLKSEKQIGLLFQKRQSVGAYPLRVFWIENAVVESTTTENAIENVPKNSIAAQPLIVAFSVSKKTFKQAVKRNRYKRLMREAHRLNKHRYCEKLLAANKTISVMFLFVGKEACDFVTIQKKYIQLMDKLFLEVKF